MSFFAPGFRRRRVAGVGRIRLPRDETSPATEENCGGPSAQKVVNDPPCAQYQGELDHFPASLRGLQKPLDSFSFPLSPLSCQPVEPTVEL